MTTITMLNQKGGVGKSSCVHHLSGTFAQMGLRVLLVDNDFQSSLSQGFWGPIATRALDPSETIASLYRGDRPFPDQIIKPAGVPGIDLVAGSRFAGDYNIPRPHEAPDEIQHCLREFLADIRGAYDLVLIDCHPDLHLMAWASLVASEFVCVPLSPEDYAAMGIIDVQESIARVQSGPNPHLRLLGFLLTKVEPRQVIHQIYEERLRSLHGDDVFGARVMKAAVYVEAIAKRVPIAQYKPKGEPARGIRALADEILARVASQRQHSPMEAA